MLIVAKSGGKILEEGLPLKVASDIKQIAVNNKFVFVHGGGIEVTEIATKLGKPQKFIISPEGFRSRYTDKETAEIYTMVMAGRINKQIVTMLQRNSVSAIGISGLDGLLIRARRKKRLVVVNERGRRMAIDGGYTGSITEINANLLNLLIDNQYVPVVSPIAISEEFEPLNVDGDRVAAYVAASIKADMLILLTDVEGIMVEGKFVRRLSVSQVKEILGTIGPGMITKAHAALQALAMGVKEVVISSGMLENPISSAVKRSSGTVISYE